MIPISTNMPRLTALGTARRRKRPPGRARSPAKSLPCGQWQFGVDERGKGRLNTQCKSKTMKTKICLLGFFALVTLAIAAPHTWTFQKGGTFEGDYYSSGTTAVIVRKDGTNHIFQIADLSTNDLAYVTKIKADQKLARLDAEVKQMQQAGWVELSTDLIKNFPEKLRDQIPGDGTIIHKYGWMDAAYRGMNELTRDHDSSLSFGVIDSKGDYFDYCFVAKKLFPKKSFTSAEILAGALDNYTQNPLANVAFNLKRGDNIRLIGYCDDSLPFAESPNGERASHASFFIERIEIIETAAEIKAKDEAAKNP
jgi:hypothetical protein